MKDVDKMGLPPEVLEEIDYEVRRDGVTRQQVVERWWGLANAFLSSTGLPGNEDEPTAEDISDRFRKKSKMQKLSQMLADSVTGTASGGQKEILAELKYEVAARMGTSEGEAFEMIIELMVRSRGQVMEDIPWEDPKTMASMTRGRRAFKGLSGAAKDAFRDLMDVVRKVNVSESTAGEWALTMAVGKCIRTSSPSTEEGDKRAGFYDLIQYGPVESTASAPDRLGARVLVKGMEVARELVRRGGLDPAMWAAHWHSLAFPTVRMTPSMAAALAMTDVPDDFADSEINAPWKAFAIEIPAGLLVGDGHEITHVKVDRYLPEATFERDGWWISIVSNPPSGSSYTGSPRLSDLYKDDIAPEGCPDWMARAYPLAGRMAVGAMLELNDPSGYRRRSKKAIKASRGKQTVPGVEVSEYILGRDVRVDCVQHVRDIASGASERTKSVRHLVRGHRRMVAHGPSMSLRRRQWIEPYWQGEEGGPILVRGHAI